jgi:hypothetical protein
MPSPDQYIPGVCNIGAAEIKQRRYIGWLAAGAAILLWAALVQLNFAREWRVLLFLPAFVAAIGYLQAAWHFCAKFGLHGVFNFRSTTGHTDTVEQAEFRRQDRRTAVKIIVISALIAAAVTAAAYFLPR